MESNRALTELVNIGENLALRLYEVGILNEQDLRFCGAAEAYKRIDLLYPSEVLAVCEYLYAFEGAITDKHWDDIGEKRKKELRNQVL